MSASASASASSTASASVFVFAFVSIGQLGLGVFQRNSASVVLTRLLFLDCIFFQRPLRNEYASLTFRNRAVGAVSVLVQLVNITSLVARPSRLHDYHDVK